MIFSSNKVYNFLKQVALVWLPAAATLYAALAALWSLDYVAQVVGSISAADTFLGVVLHISSNSYSVTPDGKLVVDRSDPEKDIYRIELEKPPEEIISKGDKIVKLAVTGAGKAAGA